MARGALRTLCGREQLERSLEMLRFKESAAPIDTYLALLQACNNQSCNPYYVKQIHAHLSLHNVQLSGLLGDYLVVSLAKCGAVDDAIFTSLCLPCRTVFSWTSIITACTDTGRNMDALRMHQYMKDDGVTPDSFTFVSLLKSCAAAVSGLHLGKQLHVAALWQGVASDVYVCSALIHMYGKCGATVEAELVFCSALCRTLVLWSAMVSAYIDSGQGVKALRLYRQMHDEGVELDQLALMLVIQACCSILEGGDKEEINNAELAIEVGRVLHADAKRKAFLSDVYLANTLLNFYGKSGAIEDAEQVFQGVDQCDIVSWNAMLSAYVEQGHGHKALQLYTQIHGSQMTCPDELTFVFAIQSCMCLVEEDAASFHFEADNMRNIALHIGQMLHMEACMRGFDLDGFVGSSLVKMYGKCKAVFESEHVFVMSLCHDTASWNSLMSVYVEQAQEHLMVVPEVHAHVAGRPLLLFRQMQSEGVHLDQLAFALALQACIYLAEKNAEEQPAKIMLFEIGQALHADASRKGFSSESYIGSRLMSMYGKCGTVREAEHVVCLLSKQTVSAWNALLSTYAEQGQMGKALQLYNYMLTEGFQPNKWSFVLVFQVCAILGEADGPILAGFSNEAIVLELGHAFYEDALRMGFGSDPYIVSTLISMYGKCGAIMEAEQAFGRLSECTLVPSTALMSAYVEQNQGKKALEVYKQMLKQGVTLNCVTLITVLQACSVTASLELCKQVHFEIVSAGCDQVPTVAATLVRAYGSCASMVDAQVIFSRVDKPGIVLWNACFSGLAEVGNVTEIAHLYEKLGGAGIAPDKVTFTAMLSACCHAGFTSKGLEYFHSMYTDYDLSPDLKHVGSLIDLLGRVGDFHLLHGLWNKMPMVPDNPISLCFLCACCKHGNMVLAKQAYATMQQNLE